MESAKIVREQVQQAYARVCMLFLHGALHIFMNTYTHKHTHTYLRTYIYLYRLVEK